MLSSQQQAPLLHHHQQLFHPHQMPPISSAFCAAEAGSNEGGGGFEAVHFGQQQQMTGLPAGAVVHPAFQQQLNGLNSFHQQQAMPTLFTQQQQGAMATSNGFIGMNGGTKMMATGVAAAASAVGQPTAGTGAGVQQQPGAWFFPPTMNNINNSGQQVHHQQNPAAQPQLQQQHPSDPLAMAIGMDQQQQSQQQHQYSDCGSPGLLMAPQQLLARFGPRHCTESVEVPSSEHVAEIVGRQGCKIKALRAKTNTYIKTPVRGEEPVFVVTGRHEDVAEARREIECAAEHFTQIRASRRHSQGGVPAPGHVTAYVRVPLRVVGLVVGPKGNTIKRIQQDTHTYIITPSREREPIFEVTGLPQNVEAARREIENHIYQRTGNMPITDSSASIANYDIQSAALQAHQSAIHVHSGHRPNYGALAVSTRNLMLRGQTPSPFHHQQGHFSLGDFGVPFGRFGGPFGGSERGGSTPATAVHQQQPAQQQQQHYGHIGHNQQQHGNGSGMAASTQNLSQLFNGLELDGGNGGEAQQQQKFGPHHPAGNSSSAGATHHLLRSISNNANASRAMPTGTQTSSAFSPWNASGGILTRPEAAASRAGGPVDFLDLISASSPSPLLFASSTQSAFSTGSVGLPPIGGGNNGASAGTTNRAGGGGLSSVNSSSRDEGLGDSPTNSFGRPQGTDYQYQHLQTIWNDLVDQPSGGDSCGEELTMTTALAQGQEEKQLSEEEPKTPAKGAMA